MVRVVQLCWLASILRRLHVQLPHLAIQIRAMQAQSFGGVGHVALCPLDLFLDELDLELVCRLRQGHIGSRSHAESSPRGDMMKASSSASTLSSLVR